MGARLHVGLAPPRDVGARRATATRCRENDPRTSRGHRFVAPMFPLSWRRGRCRRRSPTLRSRFARDRRKRHAAPPSVPFRHEILSAPDHAGERSPAREPRSGDTIGLIYDIMLERSANIWTLPIRRPPVRAFPDCLTPRDATPPRATASHRIRRVPPPETGRKPCVPPRAERRPHAGPAPRPRDPVGSRPPTAISRETIAGTSGLHRFVAHLFALSPKHERDRSSPARAERRRDGLSKRDRPTIVAPRLHPPMAPSRGPT